MKGDIVAVPHLIYDHLAGGAFAMNRCVKYRYNIQWREHCRHLGHLILRAYYRDTGKPCALYGFVQNGIILVVAESLGSIKDESRRCAE